MWIDPMTDNSIFYNIFKIINTYITKGNVILVNKDTALENEYLTKNFIEQHSQNILVQHNTVRAMHNMFRDLTTFQDIEELERQLELFIDELEYNYGIINVNLVLTKNLDSLMKEIVDTDDLQDKLIKVFELNLVKWYLTQLQYIKSVRDFLINI